MRRGRRAPSPSARRAPAREGEAPALRSRARAGAAGPGCGSVPCAAPRPMSSGPAGQARLGPARVEAELAEAVERVLDAPCGGDALAFEAEEVDLVDLFEAPARGRVAAPLSPVGGRAGEAPDDGVALGDELDGLILMSGNERRNAPNQSR